MKPLLHRATVRVWHHDGEARTGQQQKSTASVWGGTESSVGEDDMLVVPQSEQARRWSFGANTNFARTWYHPQMTNLETERLQLRMWQPEDLEPYIQMFAEPEIGQFLGTNGQPLNRHEAWRSLAVQIGHWHLKGFGMFAVVERATGDFVGRIGALQPEGWPDFELGWALRRKYWGQGYATEAVQACIRWSFSNLQKSHLISVIDPINTNSIGVAKRVGEKLEGTTFLPHLPGKPLLQYGLHRKDWSG